MNSEIDKLEKRLASLKHKKVANEKTITDSQKIRMLKKQIRQEEYNQSKSGKVLNALGDATKKVFGAVGTASKKVLQEPTSKKGKDRQKEVQDMIRDL